MVVVAREEELTKCRREIRDLEDSNEALKEQDMALRNRFDNLTLREGKQYFRQEDRPQDLFW